MKILQVIPRFNPSLGGGVDVVYNISKYLTLHGHDVTIATTDYLFDADYAQSLESIGVKVLPFKHLFNCCLFIPSPGLKGWCNQHVGDFDVVHLNGTRSYQNSVIMKYAIRAKIPIVLQAHGSIMRIVERKSIKWLYDQFWGKKLYASASAFLALSNSEADMHWMMGIPRKKIYIVPNGVDLTCFATLPPKGTFRRKYSITDNEKIVLYLGRLHKSKGLDLLVEAFADLSLKHDHVRLVFVGPDGGFKNDILVLAAKRNIMKKIQFTGIVSERDKYAAFIDSDVFVTPKFYGFPITFAESCACGLPIVTTNAGDYLDWIDGKTGLSTKYTGLDISGAMEKILMDPDLSKTFRNNCKSVVKSDFNWEIIAKKVAMVYKGLR